jgi:hypothetical protein
MKTSVLLLLVCVLAPASAEAHEIGTTEVRLRVGHDGRWSAAITTGPQSLVNKLEVQAGVRPSSGLDAAALEDRLRALLPEIASHLHVRFDGVRSNSTVSIASIDVPPDTGRAAFVVLAVTGESRPGAATVTWRDDLVYSTYALVLEREDDRPVTTWIDAGSDSEPVPLTNAPGTWYRPRVVVPASVALAVIALVLAFERMPAL